MTPRLVLFDVDGTLVDSRSIILAAIEQTSRILDRPMPDPTFALAGVGLSLEPLMRRLYGEDAPQTLITKAVEAYKEAFHALRSDPAHHEPAFPGAEAAVATLAAREDVVLGIATGKSRRGVAHIVERFGWQDVFTTVQTADDAPSKPHPAMVLQAARETGLDPARAIVIGDTRFDMEMARAAGGRAIGVSWGNHPVETLHAAGAAALIDRFDELSVTLEALWQDEHER